MTAVLLLMLLWPPMPPDPAAGQCERNRDSALAALAAAGALTPAEQVAAADAIAAEYAACSAAHRAAELERRRRWIWEHLLWN